MPVMIMTDAKKLVREPMYQQMNEILRVLLKTGEFAEGDRFLTERQIAERFQVSRPTKFLRVWFQKDCLNSKKG
jgi:DNA-binding FadR family transcriptional regulator